MGCEGFFLNITLWGSSCCTNCSSHTVKVIQRTSNQGRALHPCLSGGFKFRSILILDQLFFSFVRAQRRNDWRLRSVFSLSAVSAVEYCIGHVWHQVKHWALALSMSSCSVLSGGLENVVFSQHSSRLHVQSQLAYRARGGSFTLI